MPLQSTVSEQRFFERALRYINRRVFAKDQILNVDDLIIALPAYHKLPEYLAFCDQYDRFLPILAGCLDPDSVIIDVGANCGDSLALMYGKNSKAHYIAIEPDPEFDLYLQRNVAEIKKKDRSAQIMTIQKMIGKSILSADLAGTGGTKSAIIGSGNLKTISLDEICKINAIEKVHFIKSDVDGYDYDVIASASETIKRDKPLLFFECLLNTSGQRSAYESCLKDLDAAGYCDWTIFDNYGHILLRTQNVSEIRFFFDYTEKNRIKGKHMPFHYIDVLAGFPQHEALISQALTLHDQATKAAIS